MKSNELRIGNYLETKTIKWNQVHAQVYHIEHDRLSLEYAGDPSINRNYYDVYPIPLTEKWLLDFGFTQDQWGNFYIGENPITKDYLFYIKTNSTGVFFYRNGHHKIQYVHQLQNLYFALTGEELKLKN